MEIVTQLDAAHRLGVVGWVGADVPLHASSAGKLVLAELSQSELETWFEEAQPLRLTARTVTTVSGLAAGASSCQAPRLGRDRRRAGGWPRVPLCADSRPRRASRRGIGLSGPTSRLGAARRRQLVPFVLEAATEVEQALDPVASRVELEGLGTLPLEPCGSTSSRMRTTSSCETGVKSWYQEPTEPKRWRE